MELSATKEIRVKTAKTILATGILLLLTLCSSFSSVMADKTYVIENTGEFATIETNRTRGAMGSLSDDAPLQERKIAIEIVTDKPDTFAPPAFFALSHALFGLGHNDEAVFWFYAGQLRARYDANRCADVSARSAVTALAQQHGAEINQYAFTNLPKLQTIVAQVIEFDRKTPHNYDNRWINLHGLNATMAGMGDEKAAKAPLSLPKEQWAQIAEKTRVDYVAGFEIALKELKARENAPVRK